MVMVAACAAQKATEEPEVKKELALWQVLRYKQPGEKTLLHEDKWYRYTVEFDYVIKGPFIATNMIGGNCPIDKAKYSVYDKETKETVRDVTYQQVPCDPCHRR